MGKKIFLIMAGVVMAAVLLLAACDYKQPGAAGGKEPKAQGQQSDQTTSQDQEMKVECGSDADCGKEIVGEPSCFQGNILIPRKMPRCDYPGTINSNCRMASEDKVILCSGSEFCRDGECLEISKQPCKDTDGGKTYNISGEVTDGFMEVFVDNCMDDATLFERYCSDGEFGRGLTEEYRCKDRCSNGKCVEDDD